MQSTNSSQLYALTVVHGANSQTGVQTSTYHFGDNSRNFNNVLHSAQQQNSPQTQIFSSITNVVNIENNPTVNINNYGNIGSIGGNNYGNIINSSSNSLVNNLSQNYSFAPIDSYQPSPLIGQPIEGFSNDSAEIQAQIIQNIRDNINNTEDLSNRQKQVIGNYAVRVYKISGNNINQADSERLDLMIRMAQSENVNGNNNRADRSVIKEHNIELRSARREIRDSLDNSVAQNELNLQNFKNLLTDKISLKLFGEHFGGSYERISNAENFTNSPTDRTAVFYSQTVPLQAVSPNNTQLVNLLQLTSENISNYFTDQTVGIEGFNIV